MPFSAFRFTLLLGVLIGATQLAGTLGVYGAGLHGAPDDIEAGQRFENIASFAAIMACLTLGLRSARRARHAAGQGFPFGAGARLALGAAAAGGLFTAAGQYLYAAYLNPDYPAYLAIYYTANFPIGAEDAARATEASRYAVGYGFRIFLFSLMIGVAFSFLFRDRAAPSESSSTPGA